MLLPVLLIKAGYRTRPDQKTLLARILHQGWYGCHTAGNSGDYLYGLCATVSRHGVPSIVGMQTEISNDAASKFSGTFYRAAAAGEPIDSAVTRSRIELAGDCVAKGTLEAFGPVLTQSMEIRTFNTPNLQFSESAGDIGKKEARMNRWLWKVAAPLLLLIGAITEHLVRGRSDAH